MKIILINKKLRVNSNIYLSIQNFHQKLGNIQNNKLKMEDFKSETQQS